jgi:hypothetical protein
MKDQKTSSCYFAHSDYWARILAALAFTFSLWIAIRYAMQPIAELEAFRQTETALTAYWMIKEGWQLAYQTPGWGYPWAVPIEFPIYQSLVAFITWIGHLPIELVGRLVSYFFLIACAWPAFQITRRLKLPPDTTWVFCALLWSSPLYLYWGRTFMIETAAVFFTLAAIPYLLDLRAIHPSLRSVIIGSLWATLGMLQKSITTGPVLMILGIFLIAPSIRNWRSALPLRRFMFFLLAFGLPLFIGVLWTVYADVIKNYNFVGRELNIKFRLSAQYLGTISQHLSPSTLKDIFWTRILNQNAAGFLGITLLIGALWSGQGSTRTFIAICIVLTAFPTLLFFNVNLLLEYYQVASVVFLLAALALCCVVWLPTVTHWRLSVPMVATMLVIANLLNFWSDYGQIVRAQPGELRFVRSMIIGDIINRYVPDDTGIIVFGLNEGLASISPEIPYFSQRKGFTVPDWREDLVEKDPASYLGDKELGAIVFCSTRNKERYNRIIAQYSPPSMRQLFCIQGCYVWLPNIDTVFLADGTLVFPSRFIE